MAVVSDGKEEHWDVEVGYEWNDKIVRELVVWEEEEAKFLVYYGFWVSGYRSDIVKFHLTRNDV